MDDRPSTSAVNEEEWQGPKPRKRKLHTYEKVRKSYEKIVADKKKKEEERQEREQQRKEAKKRAKKMRWERNRALSQRTAKGQPNLNAQVQFLLKKIQLDFGKGVKK